MLRLHWSSCALHNCPTRVPKACDCGRFTSEPVYGVSSDRRGYSQAVRLQNFVQLQLARSISLGESYESPVASLTSAMRSVLGRRHRHTQAYVARRGDARPCTKKWSSDDDQWRLRSLFA